MSGATLVAFDIETAPDEGWRHEPKAALDPHKAHIVGMSFTVAEGSAVYVPFACIGEQMAALWQWLEEALFTSPAVTKIAHNLAFESAFLYHRGIVLREPVYDTIAAAQMTLKSKTQFRGLGDSGLKGLVKHLFDIDLPSFEEVTWGRFFDELDIGDPATINYACADADYTLRLYHRFNVWFDRYLPRHRWIVEHIESPTAVYCGIMKHNGLLVDAALMEEKGDEAGRELDRLRQEIAFIIGDVPIGANASTSAFKRYLYNDLGLPVQKTTAKMQRGQSLAGGESLDDEALVLLSEWCAEHRPELVPLFRLVQEYRRWGKIQSTYITGYARYVNPATGRIHADLLPLATETGRFAARNPNLQNMPRASADDVGVRNFFVVPEGCMLLSLDFSQIELRVGAFYCRDAKMLETYRTGGDIHDATATVIFGRSKHSKEQRTIAKNVNFGTFYGLFPRGLQRTLKLKAGLNLALEQCERIIANLKAGYPALADWQDKVKYQAERVHYVETWLGRRRYLPGITSTDWGKKSFAQRCALNTPIQGTAGEDWEAALQRNDKGLIANTIFNIRLVLENDPHLQGITYNMLADAMEFCGPAPWKRPNFNFWRDADDAQLESYLEENYFGFSQAKLKTAVTKVVDDRSYHPVREFLDALPPWDGIPRVERLLPDTFGAEDSAYVRAVTRKVLCAAVMRVNRPGIKFDSMLVLNGPQGIGKSTLIARLGGPWFCDNINITDTSDKSAPEKLLGHWILEFSELAGMRKVDIEKLKAFISRQDDKYRAAYARAVTSHPRQCVFLGSTNSEHGFLRDVTGNRRFWPVKTPGVGARPSWALTQEDVRQIWAETLLFVANGEALYLDKALNREAQAQQRAAMEADDREGMVRDYLETPLPEDWTDMDLAARREFLNPGNALAPAYGVLRRETVSNMEIWCECFGNRREALLPRDSHAICAMMERLGWQRTAERASQPLYGLQRIYRRRD